MEAGSAEPDRLRGAAVRDLRVYAQALGGDAFHYRDNLGLEAGAAASGLLRLRDRIAGRAPIALGVITGTGYGFTRLDEVVQIPIGALAP